jgi:hypothetical protein
MTIKQLQHLITKFFIFMFNDNGRVQYFYFVIENLLHTLILLLHNNLQFFPHLPILRQLIVKRFQKIALQNSINERSISQHLRLITK